MLDLTHCKSGEVDLTTQGKGNHNRRSSQNGPVPVDIDNVDADPDLMTGEDYLHLLYGMASVERYK